MQLIRAVQVLGHDNMLVRCDQCAGVIAPLSACGFAFSACHIPDALCSPTQVVLESHCGARRQSVKDLSDLTHRCEARCACDAGLRAPGSRVLAGLSCFGRAVNLCIQPGYTVPSQVHSSCAPAGPASHVYAICGQRSQRGEVCIICVPVALCGVAVMWH